MAQAFLDQFRPSANWIWDTNTLSWVPQTAAAAGGGGPVSIADGQDVTQGTKADVAWVAGDGTVISLLKAIAGGGGGSAVTIANGADATQGAVADAAVVSDANGTLSGKLRGLVKWAFERMPAALGQAAMANSLPIVIASDQSAVPVSGTVALGAGAATIGTVTANAGTNLNTSLLALEVGGNLAAIKSKTDNIPALGQALAAASTPVVLTAAQLTTLTPPAAITGFALESGGNLAASATSLAILDDWDENDRAKVNPIVGQAGVQGASGAVTALTQRVVLATDVALPAGTNAIGKLAANDGVDIGDVTINNAAGAAAVNVQDGGNSITVDATSWPLPTGASTSANQATEIASLASIDTKLTSPLAVIGTKTTNNAAPSAHNVETIPAVATASAPSYTEGNAVKLSTDLTGALRIAGSISASTSADVQEADDDAGYVDGNTGKNLVQTPDGRLRVLIAGLVSDVVSSYTSGDTKTLSLATDGRLRVVTANESFNFTPWGDPETWGSDNAHINGPHPLSAW